MSLIPQKFNLTVEFLEPILGTVPKDKTVYSTFIATKAKELSPEKLKEELDSIQEREEKGWTGFHFDPKTDQPFLYDYVLRGFMKSSCQALRRFPESQSSKLTSFKSRIDGNVFVFPRKILLNLPKGTNMKKLDVLERPLRCETAQGPRVTVCRADLCPMGTTFNAELHVLDPKINVDQLIEWFNYGLYSGFGQWRSGGYGRFSFKIKEA